MAQPSARSSSLRASPAVRRRDTIKSCGSRAAPVMGGWGGTWSLGLVRWEEGNERRKDKQNDPSRLFFFFLLSLLPWMPRAQEEEAGGRGGRAKSPLVVGVSAASSLVSFPSRALDSYSNAPPLSLSLSPFIKSATAPSSLPPLSFSPSSSSSNRPPPPNLCPTVCQEGVRGALVAAAGIAPQTRKSPALTSEGSQSQTVHPGSLNHWQKSASLKRKLLSSRLCVWIHHYPQLVEKRNYKFISVVRLLKPPLETRLQTRLSNILRYQKCIYINTIDV